MSLYQAFGIGRIKEYNYFIEATDHVVPNSQLDSLKNSASSLSGFPTVLDYLDHNSSEKKPLKFAIASRYGAEFKWRECHIDEGHVLSAITYVDNYPQVFLSQYLKRLLRQKGLSVVRQDKGYTYVYPKIDTAAGIYELPTVGYKPYSIEVLYQDYYRYPGSYDGFVSDYIVKKAALAQFAESESFYTLIGSFGECMKIGDYFQKYYPKRTLPFNLQKLSLSEGYWRDTDILCTSRFTEKGREIFLSREGYTLLGEGGFVILRAAKRAEGDEWRKLEMLLDPEVVKW